VTFVALVIFVNGAYAVAPARGQYKKAGRHRSAAPPDTSYQFPDYQLTRATSWIVRRVSVPDRPVN
jgi:hypothetical protein